MWMRAFMGVLAAALVVASGYLGYDLFTRSMAIGESGQGDSLALAPTVSAPLPAPKEFRSSEIKPQLSSPLREDLPPPGQSSEAASPVVEKIRAELSGLKDNPDSMPTRVMLMQTLSTLATTDRTFFDVHELALEQFFRNDKFQAGETSQGVGTSSFSYFLPVLAHEVALKSSDDVDEAFDVTMAGLRSYSDPSVRYSLVRNFRDRYPDFEEDLQQGLIENGISPQYLKEDPGAAAAAPALSVPASSSASQN